MEEKRRSVCVIGAGMCGLVSVKCMVDAGLDVTCFEKDRKVGGRWHIENKDPICRSTVTNLPKYLSCYSDFPLPDEFPLYIPAELYSKYFEMYAENFGLFKYIHFEHEVIKAQHIFDGAQDEKEYLSNMESCRWRITYKDANGEVLMKEFDYLVVSSGFYTLPNIPESFQKLLKNFNGKVLHSIDYIDSQEFKDQTVVVCGMGNTGGDISVEVSSCSQRTCLSTSRGSYVFGRLTNDGKVPIDDSTLRIIQYLPTFLHKLLKEKAIRTTSSNLCDMSKWRLLPKGYTSVLINDDILHRIASGKIEIKPSIDKIDGSTIYFSNGTKVLDVDAVIMCTGYRRKFSFLEDSIVQIRKGGKHIPLYKGMFLPRFRNTIAFVGMTSVFGSVALTSEMQTRYIAEVFKGEIILPGTSTMEIEVTENIKKSDSMHGDGLKEYNQIDDAWSWYDELATEIGCRPSLSYLLLTDPVLFWHLFKNYNPHEYRLFGPNKWNGAREAILNKEQSTFGFMKGSRENSI